MGWGKKSSAPPPSGKDCPRCSATPWPGSVKVTHGLCMGKGCNECNKGSILETCPRCHGRGVVD